MIPQRRHSPRLIQALPPTDRLRHFLEQTIDEAERLQADIAPNSETEIEAWEDLEYLLSILRVEGLDALVRVERSHRAWELMKHDEEYGA